MNPSLTIEKPFSEGKMWELKMVAYGYWFSSVCFLLTCICLAIAWVIK